VNTRITIDKNIVMSGSDGKAKGHALANYIFDLAIVKEGKI
jgi:hypothetical protein